MVSECGREITRVEEWGPEEVSSTHIHPNCQETQKIAGEISGQEMAAIKNERVPLRNL